MRFFFDTHADGRVFTDEDGRDFASPAEARKYAVETLVRLSKEAVPSDAYVDVRSEDRATRSFQVPL